MDDGFGDLELSAGQAAAALSGDPRLEQLASLQMEESRLQSLHRSFTDAQRRSKGELAITQSALAGIVQDLPTITAAAAAYRSTTGDAFRMSVDGTNHLDRIDAGIALQKLVVSRIQPLPTGAGPYQALGTVGSLSVEGRYHRGLELRVGGSDVAKVHLDWDTAIKADSLGMIRRLENTAGAAAGIRDDLILKQAAHQAAIPSLEETLTRPFDHAAELAVLQLKITDLMNDMGLSQNEDAETDVPPVMGETLGLFVPDQGKVSAGDLRGGDVVTGLRGRGQALFRVESVVKHEKTVVHELAETDEALEPVNLGWYDSVELVSRPLSALTPFERAFLKVPETDAVAVNDRDVNTGESITLQRPVLDAATGMPTGKTIMVTGTVEVRSNEWVVTDDRGARHSFNYSRWAASGASPVLRHGVVDPTSLAAELALKERDASFVHADQFLPGDVLLEDVEGLGLRGDTATGGSIYQSASFIDPVAGSKRETTGYYEPRAVTYQQGRILTLDEERELYPDGYGSMIEDLRAGDVVPAHELDRNQARRDNVTVTAAGAGTMVDLKYRFDDGEKGTCRRRCDQKITIHARRFGALTDLERATLQAPGRVTSVSAGALRNEHQGQWVRLRATKGSVASWQKLQPETGRVVAVEKLPARDMRAAATMLLELEEPGGTRTRWAASESTAVLLWEGDLPETPLDFTGLDLESAPVTVQSPPPAAEEPIVENGAFLNGHVLIGTVNLNKGPSSAASVDLEAQPVAEERSGSLVRVQDRGEIPILEHTSENSNVRNVGRDKTVLHGLLKEFGFKFSRRQELWYLNSTWKPGTRDTKVMQLISAGARSGIAFDIKDPGNTRRMALLKEGDRIRVSPGKAVIHGVDSFGMHEAVSDFPELIAEVGEGRRISTHRTPVQVHVAGRSHSFEISHESGALELVPPEEADQWKRDIGEFLPARLSADLDRRIGRRVQDLAPGQRVSVSGNDVSLADLKSYQQRRYDDANVLAVEKGPVEHTRYVLLECDQSRLWIEANATDTVPVHEARDISERGFSAPRFRIQHVNDVQPGENVSATGLRPTSTTARYQEIITATGALSGVQKLTNGEYQLTIQTNQGHVQVRQGEQHGYRPEVTTMTPGTTEGRAVEARIQGPASGLEHAPDPLLIAPTAQHPTL
jgi:hypothetical protein